MKTKRQRVVVEQTLFSELPFEEADVTPQSGHDKILEARQNVSFDEKALSEQDHAQLVERPSSVDDTPKEVVCAEEKPTYTIYPTDAVKAAAKEYFHGDTLAADVWANKYALKDSDGHLYELTPNDMHRRIAREIVRIERKYPNPLTEEEVFEVLKDFRYIVPQGSPMAGIGNNFQISSLSNCFVIGNKGSSDSYGGIMKIDQEQVQLMKRRGGVGHDLSQLRPTGSPVKTAP